MTFPTLDKAALAILCLTMPRPTRLRRVTVSGATSGATAAVVIPALNEERRIARCLRALARQAPSERFGVIVVANDCRDATAAVALETARAMALPLCVLEVEFGGRGNAALARNFGMGAVAGVMPEACSLLTTDADCVVSGDWVANSLAHLRRAEAVCGHVIPDAEEFDRLPQFCPERSAAEYEYLRASLEFESLISPDPFNPWPHHGQAPGASLAFRRAAFEAISGFADMTCGEDRDIVLRLRMAGRPVVFAPDVSVTASCRLQGRAVGGMADALARVLADPASPVDESISRATCLMQRADRALRRGEPFRFGAPVAPGQRLRPCDLPPELTRLRRVNTALAAMSAAKRPKALSKMLGSLPSRAAPHATSLPDARLPAAE
ncbi:glycosyltransferase [Marinibacterium profundimaris]|uniref:glycosyltransferase n=1 Tax=Marinibacterium profundimaris TaxID=1679460 RepID=UPI000B521CA2|nr:glycosyltransferase family 2 protein [Marinibacterium profundimaris]